MMQHSLLHPAFRGMAAATLLGASPARIAPAVAAVQVDMPGVSKHGVAGGNDPGYSGLLHGLHVGRR